MVKLQDMYYEHMAAKYPELKRGIPKRITHRKHLPVYLFKNADLLMEHFDEISQAINDIGLIRGKEKKAQAIELLTRYAPEMAKMKEQIKSVNAYVDSLKDKITDEKEYVQFWRGRTEELQDAIKERDDKIYELQAKQKKLQALFDLLPPGMLDMYEEKEKQRRKEQRRNNRIR